MSILTEAKAMKDTIVEYRRYLHTNAEVGFDLPLTTKYVTEQLIKMGYDPQEVGGGVVAIAGGKKPGKVFLIRGDMDALPIVEESDIPYKSQTENMHACGHDFHTAMMLAAARLLKNHEDEIEGTVKLMFQPAEELLCGAVRMVKEGLLECPKVDAAMMIHVVSGMEFETGQVLLPSGGFCASAADWFEIHVQGKGSHGAMPNTGVDPLNVITHIFTALQAIHAREMPTGASLALTVGQMHGGRVSNVVPDDAYMTGTIRTRDEEVRKFVKRRMVELSEGIAQTFRASASVKFSTECPIFMADEKLADDVSAMITKMVTKEGTISLKDGLLMAGSEDFAVLAEQVPAIFVGLAAGAVSEGHTFPLHHPKVTFNEDALPVGAAVYAECAMKWLSDNK